MVLLQLPSPNGLRVDLRDSSMSVYFVDDKLPHHPQKQAEIRKMCGQLSPQAQLVRESVAYNCVGLVLGGRRGWLDCAEDEFDASLRAALAADGFDTVPVDQATSAGDLVTYERSDGITHVAVVTGIHYPAISGDLMLLSKWGEWPEFLHSLSGVPQAFGRPTEGWKQRFTT